MSAVARGVSEWTQDAQADLATTRHLLPSGHFNWAVSCARTAVEKAHAAEGPPSAVYTRRTAAKAIGHAGELMKWIRGEVAAASEHLRKGT